MLVTLGVLVLLAVELDRRGGHCGHVGGLGNGGGVEDGGIALCARWIKLGRECDNGGCPGKDTRAWHDYGGDACTHPSALYISGTRFFESSRVSGIIAPKRTAQKAR